MKIKIKGYRSGQSRTTINRTYNIDVEYTYSTSIVKTKLGNIIYDVLKKSDFISIRRVED